MTSTAPALNILYQGIVQVESNNQVAIRDIESLFGNGRGKQAIDLSFSEPHERKDLLSEADLDISCIAVPGADEHTEPKVGTT